MRKPIPRGTGKSVELVRVAIFTAYVVKERPESSPDQLGCSVSDHLHGTLEVKLGSDPTGGLVECVERARFIRKSRRRKLDISDKRSYAVEGINVSRLFKRRESFEQGLRQRMNSIVDLR
jgi:hypothetical protein